MIKVAIVVGLLASTSAWAQPHGKKHDRAKRPDKTKPADPPKPAEPPTPAEPPKPADSPKQPDKPAGTTPGTTEKAGTNEGLGQGGDQRPWAVGVPVDRQNGALKAFQDGNVALNDGLFPNAVERYREALKSWDHPAIHYNMALALMNLDQPIEVEDSLKKAIKYDAAPLEKDK